MSSFAAPPRALRTQFQVRPVKEQAEEVEECSWFGKLLAGAGAAAAAAQGAHAATPQRGVVLADPSAPSSAVPSVGGDAPGNALQEHGALRAEPVGSAALDAAMGAVQAEVADESFNMFDPETQEVLERVQFPAPLKPLGMGVDNVVYEVPSTHPEHEDLCDELGVSNDARVALKFNYNHEEYKTMYGTEHMVLSGALKRWGRERGVIPQEERISRDRAAELFFAKTENAEDAEALQDIWKNINTKHIASPLSAEDDHGVVVPTFPLPIAKDKPVTAVEVFTPIFTVGTALNDLVAEVTGSSDGLFLNRIPKQYLWATLFEGQIKEDWTAYIKDVIEELGIVPNDNHSKNFGLRLHSDWKERMKDYLVAHADTFNNQPVPEVDTEKEYWTQEDLQTFVAKKGWVAEGPPPELKAFTEGLRSAIFAANVDDFAYHALVALDVDHFSENTDYYDMVLEAVEERVKETGQQWSEERKKTYAIEMSVKRNKPWELR